MTRKEIEADIKKTVGNFPTFSQAADYLGMSPHTAREFLEDVPSYRTKDDARGRRFFACDLARRLEECRE